MSFINAHYSSDGDYATSNTPSHTPAPFFAYFASMMDDDIAELSAEVAVRRSAMLPRLALYRLADDMGCSRWAEKSHFRDRRNWIHLHAAALPLAEAEGFDEFPAQQNQEIKDDEPSDDIRDFFERDVFHQPETGIEQNEFQGADFEDEYHVEGTDHFEDPANNHFENGEEQVVEDPPDSLLSLTPSDAGKDVLMPDAHHNTTEVDENNEAKDVPMVDLEDPKEAKVAVPQAVLDFRALNKAILEQITSRSANFEGPELEDREAFRNKRPRRDSVLVGSSQKVSAMGQDLLTSSKQGDEASANEQEDLEGNEQEVIAISSDEEEDADEEPAQPVPPSNTAPQAPTAPAPAAPQPPAPFQPLMAPPTHPVQLVNGNLPMGSWPHIEIYTALNEMKRLDGHFRSSDNLNIARVLKLLFPGRFPVSDQKLKGNVAQQWQESKRTDKPTKAIWAGIRAYRQADEPLRARVRSAIRGTGIQL